MSVTNYITANGMLVGEMTGGVMTAYGPDALGSVVATYSGTSLENTYQYKPYGATLAKTGAAADPSFLWNGGSGYRATDLPDVNFYVRRRHAFSQSGLWTTVDAEWPSEPAYVYADSNPVSLIDPSGLGGQKSPPPKVCACCPTSVVYSAVKCIAGLPLTYQSCPAPAGYTGFGHIVTITLNFNLYNSNTKQSGPCNCDLHEVVQYIAGGKVVKTENDPLPFLQSSTYQDFVTCQNDMLSQTDCSGSWSCQLTDVPMKHPPRNVMGPKAFPWGRVLSQTTTLSGPNPSQCPPVSATWMQSIEWTGNGQAAPPIWTP